MVIIMKNPSLHTDKTETILYLEVFCLSYADKCIHAKTCTDNNTFLSRPRCLNYVCLVSLLIKRK